MARNQIGDGFDLEGTIDPVRGTYDGAKFKYRPATGLASDILALAKTPADRFAARIQIVTDNLIKGTFVFVNDDKTEEPFELNADTAKLLHRGQFDTLFNYVMGYIETPLELEAKK